MVGVFGNEINVEEREAFSAVGSFISSILALFRQIVAYGYEVSVWLIKQLHEHPFESLAGAFNIAILLS